jgi:hypothetical protein
MRAVLALLSILSATACAGAGMSERPMTADEMPIAFAPQKVSGGEPSFDRAYDNRIGADVRRMVVTSRRGTAVMIYQSVVGDYVFSGSSLQDSLRRLVADDQEITWGASGSTRQGATATEWQVFDLQPSGVGCMGLRRELRQHAEIGNVPNAAQAIAIGFLCRQGSAMSEPDAIRLAAVLQLKT